MPKKSKSLYSPGTSKEAATSDRAVFEVYQAFMSGYVRRINEATLKVTIGGIRIGSAKQTRLAQINLKSRIITFSRFAIENVPERGRRYLVIHELAHVNEPSHNKRFWQLVERFEPDYRQVSQSLQVAFRRNVKKDQGGNRHLAGSLVDLGEPELLLSHGSSIRSIRSIHSVESNHQNSENWENAGNAALAGQIETFECLDDEFDMWDPPPHGTIYGGSDFE